MSFSDDLYARDRYLMKLLTRRLLFKKQTGIRSCFELFEMFFEVKNLHSLEEAVETEVFHSQTFKQTIQNSF